MADSSKPASATTAAANREALSRYAMEDRQDFADRDRGFLAPLPDKLYAGDGRVIFDAARFDYIGDGVPAPDTVNPSLWRQSQLIRKGGPYKVVDGVFQVRNNDIANLTVIEGETGLVVVDCMASVEAATQAMGMIREHVSDKPVAAVINTHTHIDHYGGVMGVVSVEDVASGKVPIIAPGTIASFVAYRAGASDPRSRTLPSQPSAKPAGMVSGPGPTRAVPGKSRSGKAAEGEPENGGETAGRARVRTLVP
ncbi:MBL fold metallo-hydrolase [Streptomyces sp. NPDC053253]|uniref:MBL fold metallo-hydrolase n=1 Tax=Streptomyces sp. NPDC053253 TaxID=3365699 RepID=UPI0037D1C027